MTSTRRTLRLLAPGRARCFTTTPRSRSVRLWPSSLTSPACQRCGSPATWSWQRRASPPSSLHQPHSLTPPHRSLASSSSSSPSPPPLSLLRNVGIIAHIDAGKTTTTERFLFYSHRIRHPGDVDRGDTHTDFLPEERRRGITIKAATTSVPWRGHSITLIDTPGHVDFTQEVEGSMRVMDGAVLLLDAVKGVQAQTLTVYQQAQRTHTPTIAYVNKMDRDGAELHQAARSITQRLGKPAALLQLPLYETAQLSSLLGAIDLIAMEQVMWEPHEQGSHYTRSPLPSMHPQHAEALAARERLLELLAERDDAFLSLFLSSSPSAADVRAVVRRLTLTNAIIPVLCGSSLRNTGVQLLMDAVIDFLPSPSEVTVTVRGGGKKLKKSKHQSARRAPAERPLDEQEERVVAISEKGPLLALAFKVTHDLSRGAVPLVFVRVYSGVLHAKDVLLNSFAGVRSGVVGVRERALKLLHVDGEDQTEVQSIRTGCVGALVGLHHTMSGDTLVRAGEEEVWMDSVVAPEPVFFAAVEADNAEEDARMRDALQCIVREDASVSVAVSEDTGQTVLRGQGQLHLEVVFHRLQHDFRVKAQLGKLRVAYREGLIAESEAELYAAHQGADAFLAIKVEPLPPSSGVVVDVSQAERWTAEEALSVATRSSASSPSAAALPLPTLASASLPLTSVLAQALQSTLHSALQRGPLHGFPLLDVSLTVTRYFLTPTSTASSLRYTAAVAARRLLQAMADSGQVVVLEPMMSVVVVAEKRHVGEVLSDLTGVRRGVIGEVDGAHGEGGGDGAREEIKAEVPLIEMVGYADALRSRTQGTATYSMKLSTYAPSPQDAQQRLH